ncbi:hypothetical protein HanRHA438_Chr05g0239361 [Helianthus annuus]|nr:hypothetical protein HanRHA438_Chr05g0239361 [Helianthus annuus]
MSLIQARLPNFRNGENAYPSITYRDANSDGLSTAAHPAASAGATFHVAISKG